MAVNQQQIAEELNLSVATVSRALKGDNAICHTTRAQVLDTASRMGYKIRVSGRYRKKSAAPESSSQPICILIQSDNQTYSADSNVARFLAGMSSAASELDIPLLVHYINYKDRDCAFESSKLPVPLREGNVHGVILLHYFPENVVRRFAENFSCVSIIYDYRVAGVDVVGMNETEQVAWMTSRLIEKGHRTIGFAGNLGKHCWVRRREAGRVESLLAAGLSLTPEYIFSLDAGNNPPETYDRIASAVKQGMTALIAGNDEIGYEIIHQMHRREIEVPRDLAITGFDGISVPPGMPQLFTAKMPAEEMGAAAVVALMERNRHPVSPSRQILLDSYIINGDSV